MVPSGSWAEVVAVPTALLAEFPDNVTFAQAATLPVAGLTALYGVEKGGFLLNRKVLVTGASGGVGYFACQLARLSGADVTALVRREERAASLRETGVRRVVVGEDVAAARSSGPYDFIVDTLGGEALAAVAQYLEPDGRCVNLGSATKPDMTLQARLASIPEGVIVLDGMERQTDIAKNLGRLAGMVADGRLRPPIDRETSWSEIAEVAQSLMDRRIAGKAVLTIS
jgi:NADPH:quinone reductase-like Zn-dependent oxidoreductase